MRWSDQPTESGEIDEHVFLLKLVWSEQRGYERVLEHGVVEAFDFRSILPHSAAITVFFDKEELSF